MGYDPLPQFYELEETPFSDPNLAKEYPLIFTSCKSAQFRHASDRNIPSLREAYPDPLVEINPSTAKHLEIQQGDQVFIETKRGRIMNTNTNQGLTVKTSIKAGPRRLQKRKLR